MIGDGGVSASIGQQYTLTCNTIGTTITTYQWRKNDSVILGEAGPTLTFSPLRLTDGGRYSCGSGTQFSVDKIIRLQGNILYKIHVHDAIAMCNNNLHELLCTQA